jgi:hypothetical protein
MLSSTISKSSFLARAPSGCTHCIGAMHRYSDTGEQEARVASRHFVAKSLTLLRNPAGMRAGDVAVRVYRLSHRETICFTARRAPIQRYRGCDCDLE